MERKGYEVEWEPHIRTTEGLRKPDHLVTIGRLALVTDAHVVGDKVDTMAAREGKIQKYSDNPGIEATFNSKPGVAEVRHCPD